MFKNTKKVLLLSLLANLSLFSQLSPAATDLNISQDPLTVSTTVPPLIMLTMSRDSKLYQEAYNDASDLNGDGVLDVGYKPAINYFGYFDSYTCYEYKNNNGGYFSPAFNTNDKKCTGTDNSYWSGDFLNYLTTSRLDAIRKVLYGGKRITDTDDQTILERAFITQDAHSWGKEFNPARDNFLISDYTPLPAPYSYTQEDGKTVYSRHLFTSVTLSSDNQKRPLLRVLRNSYIPVSGWVSRDGTVSGNMCTDFNLPPKHSKRNCPGFTADPDQPIEDMTVRVEVCKLDQDVLLEENCKPYQTEEKITYKPTGILQKYGENDSIYFGLLTGSYDHNMSGGVLRKNISSFLDEIDTSGKFQSSTNGIVSTLNRLSMLDNSFSRGWNGKQWKGCGLITNRVMNEGECPMWGNPLAEMMYETTRYFSGTGSPTNAFVQSSAIDNHLGLPQPEWINPYGEEGFPKCSKPFQIVISDANPNYDSDQLPGSRFASFTSDITTLDVGALADIIWDQEIGKNTTKSHFIGESKMGGDNKHLDKDGLPSAKQVDSFANIRGLSPEEPTKLGSYYSASVAFFGNITDLSSAEGEQKLKTFAISLASSLPKIEVHSGSNKITLVPLGKSVRYNKPFINPARGAHQPSNAITDYYVLESTPTSGKFVVNFGDVEQGYDNELDSIAEYAYRLQDDGKLEVRITLIYQAAGIDMHLGYAISGSNEDGVYLDISNKKNDKQQQYFADTYPDEYFNNAGTKVRDNSCPFRRWNYDTGHCINYGSHKRLPKTNTRHFSFSSTNQAATVMDPPLQYAAKWGGFTDQNNNNLPDQDGEFKNASGDIRSYFPVTNASNLGAELEKAISRVLQDAGASSSVALNVGSTDNSSSAIYQATFSSAKWSGNLEAKKRTASGFQSIWSAADKLNSLTADQRKIITWRKATTDDTGYGVPFRFPSDMANPGNNSILTSQAAELTADIEDDKQTFGTNLINYLRGDSSGESAAGFRERESKLGDIVNSDPVFVGRPGQISYLYPWKDKQFTSATMPENTPANSYLNYVNTVKARAPMVYVGANDGLLHGFNGSVQADNPETDPDESANNGKEMLAYVPAATFPNLVHLASQDYSHKPYVDSSPVVGDVFFSTNNDTRGWKTVLVSGMGAGGKAVFALNVTNPAQFSESNASSIVLWEFTDPDLGLTFSKPAITRLHNGKWAAIFGNGYNSANGAGDAFLFVVDVETGELLKKINTNTGSAEDPNNTIASVPEAQRNRKNGLSSPTAIDFDKDNIADYVVAGDLFGNLFMFDLNSNNADNWGVAQLENASNTTVVRQPLFKARSADNRPQPITTRPLADTHPKSKDPRDQIIFFATGKYLETGDKSAANQTTQSVYAVSFFGARAATASKPRAYAKASTRSALLQQKIEAETSKTDNRKALRIISNNTICWENCGTGTTHRGWYIDVLNQGGSVASDGSITTGSNTNNYGERVVFDPHLDSDRIVFTTLIPSTDICAAGGTSWLMALDRRNGGRLNTPPFDANNDRKISKDDIYNNAIPSGVKNDSGITPLTRGLPNSDGTITSTTNDSSGVLGTQVESGSPLNQGRVNWLQLR